MREEGYYWVRIEGGAACVCSWSDGVWWRGLEVIDSIEYHVTVLSARLEPPQCVTEKG